MTRLCGCTDGYNRGCADAQTDANTKCEKKSLDFFKNIKFRHQTTTRKRAKFRRARKIFAPRTRQQKI